jgi:hypothetical protein
MTCDQEPGCWLIEAGAPPTSPFVGTWQASPQVISDSCWSSGLMLDPMTFQIAQLGPTSITLAASPTRPSNWDYTWTVLDVSGNTATTPPLSVENDLPCLGLVTGCTLTLTLTGSSTDLSLQISASTEVLGGGSCTFNGTISLIGQ